MASGISQASAPAVYSDKEVIPVTTEPATTTTSTTTSTTTTTTETTTTAPVNVKLGDANLDGNVTIADSVAILQYIGNKDKYNLSAEALSNADVYNRGDGVTPRDALTIQKLDAGLIAELPES
jgi:hypothetical protein